MLLAESQSGAFSGLSGFLGTRGSLMLDIVVVAMAVILPVLAYSIYLVRVRRRYSLHKRIQLVLALLLLVTVLLFEADMRINGWRDRAEPSPYYSGEGGISPVFAALYVHLVFATTSAVLWTAVTIRAWRNFEKPARPGRHSRSHRRWGWIAALDMVATSVTGWIFYWLAFVAT
jgi:putative membrane protein